VTLVKVVFVRRDGAKAGVLLKLLAKKVPFKTWYVKRLATVAGSWLAAIPVLELRNLEKASLLGARMVMLVADPNV